MNTTDLLQTRFVDVNVSAITSITEIIYSHSVAIHIVITIITAKP